MKFNLPDKDVFVIDAMAPTPKQVQGPRGFFSGVGTVLFDMVVNPVTGKVYVTNTEALNHVRFAGPGSFASTTVRGHFAENRITVLDPGTHTVDARHLNPHIDFSACCAPLPNAENQLSLALPQGMAITANGRTLYVAAMGSDKIAVLDTAKLEQNAYWPDAGAQIPVRGGGPTGLVLDEAHDRIYVLTRFDNAISVLDAGRREEIQHVRMFNPEPRSVTAGRRFLYDAALTSSHGDSSCASCHVSGDTGHTAWDLGNPDGDMIVAPGPFRVIFDPSTIDFHPMKAPMMTQSLRGMANHGAMHWRGDRTGAFNHASAQPDRGAFDEEEAFRQFPHTLKIPHLRNLYQKVGMFGLRREELINPDLGDAHVGDQIRGFGFTHDGTIDSVLRFVSAVGFIQDETNPDGFPRDEAGLRERRQIESFLLAYDSNLAPIVGQQVTQHPGNAVAAGPRIRLLIERADRRECDLVVHGRVLDEMRGYLYEGGRFRSDRASSPALSDSALRLLALSPGQELTYTCTPPGSGVRMGIDRDLDGILDGDEDG